MDLKRRLEAAQVKLLLQEPFVGAVLSSLRLVEASIPHLMATDGGTIYYSEECADLPDTALRGLLLHEAMHVMLKHHLRWPRELRHVGERLRAGEPVPAQLMEEWRTKRRALGLAFDVKINRTIQRSDSCRQGAVALPGEGVFSLQQFGIDDATVDASTEETLYEMLLQALSCGGDNAQGGDSAGGHSGEAGAQAEAGADGGACDVLTPGEGSMDSDAVDMTLQRAAVAANRVGGLGGFLGEELVPSVRNSLVDWKRLLVCALTQRAGGDRSWSRRSRRSMVMPVVLPGRKEERLESVTAVLDTSGSCYGAISEWLGQLKYLLDTLPVESLRVLAHGTKAQELFSGLVEEFDADELHVPRGGGTRFAPVVDLVNESPSEAVVWLTDLESFDGLPGGVLPRVNAKELVWVVPKATRIEVPQGVIGILE